MRKLNNLVDWHRLILYKIPSPCCYSTSIYEAVTVCNSKHNSKCSFNTHNFF